jgi:hypothetical protein
MHSVAHFFLVVTSSKQIQQHLQIIPKMRQLAAEKGEEGNVPVVISTCSIRESMCTHYAVRSTSSLSS